MTVSGVLRRVRYASAPQVWHLAGPTAAPPSVAPTTTTLSPQPGNAARNALAMEVSAPG